MSKTIQLKTANLPPTWEVFSTLDVNRQQTIYKTMCEQIQQQMKQVAVLQEKVKQNELLASQSLEDTKQKLSEEANLLNQEIQNLQSILEKKNNEIQFQNQSLDEQTNYITQLETEFQQLKKDYQKSEEIINELQSQQSARQQSQIQFQLQIQQLNNTIEQQEQQLDDIQNRYDNELDDRDAKISEYQVLLLLFRIKFKFYNKKQKKIHQMIIYLKISNLKPNTLNQQLNLM